MGHEVRLVTPEGFLTVPCPSYPSIRLALFPVRKLSGLINEFAPHAIHIATEGPLGHAAKVYCRKRSLNFTTSFHTQFPEYIRLRAPVPVDWSYAYLRQFHRSAKRTLVPTQSQKERLVQRGFSNVEVWGRGVDTEIFRPGADLFSDLPGPVFLNMGRVAVEKNITVFLEMELPGSKVVVGDGPDLLELKRKYPQVVFTGFKFGEELARHLASADVFVFPSLTDTFGIVLLESMACGVPVAAYPVTGPRDVVLNGITGILDDDLRNAALAALQLDPASCLEYARSHSWRKCTEVFFSYLVNAGKGDSGAILVNRVVQH
jgi:glycosyltransferase involved in cell wall biosynthesis